MVGGDIWHFWHGSGNGESQQRDINLIRGIAMYKKINVILILCVIVGIVIISNQKLLVASELTPKQCEYYILVLSENADASMIENELNNYGSVGWELATHINNGYQRYFILKRLK